MWVFCQDGKGSTVEEGVEIMGMSMKNIKSFDCKHMLCAQRGCL
jgi:hypothetical protein